ncbi:MAG: hypothetical protein CO189_07740 [candidate division Zixibacteria bacterium CG_4_9_14_3_um_filter_46_8]|nr:MAG: hypothetical protein CO189_07740 [candidate division Zixibacteria bacterium CG_4_9_14_3_um_filter_46_8]
MSIWKKSFFDPVTFAREFLEINPHYAQRKWLWNSRRKENLLCTGNRWGKSTVQAIKLLHRCFFKIRNRKWDNIPGYNAVNVSITQDQAGIVFNRAMSMVAGKRRIEPFIKETRKTPFPIIVFINGATLQARSSQNRGEYLLGNDFDFINFDEAAFEVNAAYVVDTVLTMRLADREGVIDYCSTPNGKNWFYNKYLELKNSPNSYVQTGDSRDNPAISRNYIEQRMRKLPQVSIEQNIKGLFADTQGTIIPFADLEEAIIPSLKCPEPPKPGKIYVHGWDLARKRTHTVGITLDITSEPIRLVALERFQRSWPNVYAAIRQRYRQYGGRVIIDSTGLGDVILSELEDIGAEGFNFGAGGGKAKAELLANLQRFFVMHRIILPDVKLGDSAGTEWSLQRELTELGWEDNNQFDAAMALALALWAARIDNTIAPPLASRVGKIRL